MLYQIVDGSVSAGGILILSHMNFEIKGKEKIAVVGRNGAGKTTLLRLISGELELDRDDRRQSEGIFRSRRLSVGMLHQQVFLNLNRTVEEELLQDCPAKDTFERERFEYEREYDILFTGFGFKKEDKKRLLASFSGGEQTKIGLIRLLLKKPDILLLDEPTNHLDIASVEWLEQYLQTYEHAVVMVSHDRFFLDQVADVVYEVSGKKLIKYPGNYTQYRREKQKKLILQRKAYERQQEEIARLEEIIERFKHKPTKASFARAKKKQIERMEKIDKPEDDDVHLFTGEIAPLIPGSKWVLETEHLKLGYDKLLLELSLRIRRGQKIGLLGANGVGKSTFLKTVAGLVEPFEGSYTLGNHVTLGYFDQHASEIQSEKSVVEHFHDLFPAMTEKEVRSTLGNFLFGGKEAARKVSDLSGGERARLVLAELLQSRPNFLILDEPTNHMDVQAKETLESAFQAYTGTILFVSHDRYFIRQVADAVLIFEGQSVMYYPFGYEHYLERSRKASEGESIAAQVKAEDQALIAGMRSVPKAERHRLREIPTEEAYLEWKLRLVMEKVEPAAKDYEIAERQYQEALLEYQQSKAYWKGMIPDETTNMSKDKKVLDEKTDERNMCVVQEQLERYAEVRNAAWRHWHEGCMEWLETWENEKNG
ncbi:MAG: ABC-F family ATP-binding cassette domain-containing protein [Brotaphodocola sp.]